MSNNDIYTAAIEKLRELHKKWSSAGNRAAKEIEEAFPELAEGKDEKMSKKCIELIKELKTFCMRDGQNECIAWLEKIGEQKPRMIQWKGNNLNEVIAFTGKDKNFDKWFKSFEEYEKCVHEHNDIFKLFNEDGSHYEVPVGAWIVKTPDGYNVASKAVLKQKLADKVEPNFKVGDWVVYECGEDTATLQIAGIVGETYVFSDDSTLDVVDEDTLRLWDITKDAKDGDVLYLQKDGKEHIIIYKGVIKERFRTFVSAYCAYNGIVDAFCFADVSRYVDIAYRGIIPATKEQGDTLFAKMKESGYEWDAKKKDLKKIEQKPVEPQQDVPKKIYLALDIEKEYKELERDWYKIRISHDDVEYTRTDAFIEKAVGWLRENIYQRVYKQGDCLGFPTAEFLEEFKKYMKGE